MTTACWGLTRGLPQGFGLPCKGGSWPRGEGDPGGGCPRDAGGASGATGSPSAPQGSDSSGSDFVPKLP